MFAQALLPRNYHRDLNPTTSRPPATLHLATMLRYAITSRTLFPGDDAHRQAVLLHQCARWAADGIDLIQLREKDLPAADLAKLACSILLNIHATGSATKLLINSRPDIAIATAAHGVHLTASPDELTPAQVRHLYAETGRPTPIISISCHTLEEVKQARKKQVDAILFAPIFQKSVTGQQIAAGLGLEQLHTACTAASPIPVYALGGVTLENAHSCLEAGAAGIAGIRLFLR
jgi:thiamine-phosphate pyrophosphorylase